MPRTYLHGDHKLSVRAYDPWKSEQLNLTSSIEACVKLRQKSNNPTDFKRFHFHSFFLTLVKYVTVIKSEIWRSVNDRWPIRQKKYGTGNQVTVVFFGLILEFCCYYYCICNITKKNLAVGSALFDFHVNFGWRPLRQRNFIRWIQKQPVRYHCYGVFISRIKREIVCLANFNRSGLNLTSYSLLLRHFGQVIFENWYVSLA